MQRTLFSILGGKTSHINTIRNPDRCFDLFLITRISSWNKNKENSAPSVFWWPELTNEWRFPCIEIGFFQVSLSQSQESTTITIIKKIKQVRRLQGHHRRLSSVCRTEMRWATIFLWYFSIDWWNQGRALWKCSAPVCLMKWQTQGCQ